MKSSILSKTVATTTSPSSSSTTRAIDGVDPRGEEESLLNEMSDIGHTATFLIEDARGRQREVSLVVELLL